MSNPETSWELDNVFWTKEPTKGVGNQNPAIDWYLIIAGEMSGLNIIKWENNFY